MKTIRAPMGSWIIDACKLAIGLADETCEAVCLNFNECDVVVKPGDRTCRVAGQWRRNMEHGIHHVCTEKAE